MLHNTGSVFVSYVGPSSQVICFYKEKCKLLFSLCAHVKERVTGKI
jgi:hypothetical protein